jgi:hypothetical protein
MYPISDIDGADAHPDDGLLDLHPRTLAGEELALDVKELVRLYVEDQLTLAAVAARFGCSAATIKRRLVRRGIDRRPRGPRPEHRSWRSPTWTADLARAVGVVATDGNLGRRKSRLNVTSKDLDLLEAVRACLGARGSIVTSKSGSGRVYHRLQWADSALYDWLLSVGLMPAKSLRLATLAVPDEWFRDFLRGCIDGDGSIKVYTDRYHAAKKESYVYERLNVSLVSASAAFIEWIQATTHRLWRVTGSLSVTRRPGHSPIWCLKYGKRESLDLIAWIYYDPNIPSLGRKRNVARRFLGVLGYGGKRGTGRPRVGWLYNESTR